MPWVNITLFWNSYPAGTSLDVLLQRHGPPDTFFKSKSDFVKKPIPKNAMESMWQILIKGEKVSLQWNPFGGKMKRISPSATPFPHRAGNLFMMHYDAYWEEDGNWATTHHMNLLRSFSEFLEPYVSSAPREAFPNYRDLDVGAHPSNQTSMATAAKTYGRNYYKENFNRLVLVKSRVDPANFFKHEQSIPPLSGLGVDIN